jgi:HK97 family phage prohead protease
MRREGRRMPQIQDEKEKRCNHKPLEVRTIQKDGKEVKMISGYVVKYNELSHVMRDYWGDQFVEEVASGAFDETLKMDEQKGLYDHMTSIVIGNTRTGTLVLESDSIGLKFDLELPNSEWGNYIYEGVKRGDIDGVSFGFGQVTDKWSKTEMEGVEIYKRTLLKVKLYEISPTPFAAYPSSQINCRSLNTLKETEKSEMLKELDAIKRDVIKDSLDY